MKSGMLAAESICDELWSEETQETAGIEPKSYEEKWVKHSRIFEASEFNEIISILQNKIIVHLEGFVQSS